MNEVQVLPPRSAGNVSLRLLRRDLVKVCTGGLLTERELGLIREYAAAHRHAVGGDTAITCIVVIEDEIRFHRRARKLLMELTRDQPWAQTIIVGAPYASRVLIELTINAVKLLLPETAPTSFVDTFDEAMAMIDGARTSTATQTTN